MKHILSLLFLFSFLGSGFSQNEIGPSTLWRIEDLVNISVYLTQQINDSQSKSGSGTIITHKGKFYILTASHVAEFLTPSATAYLIGTNDRALGLGLSSLQIDTNYKWVHHPVADMAIMEIGSSNPRIYQRLKMWSFNTETISRQRLTPPYDMDIDFFGYPIVNKIGEHFSPVIQTSTKASGLITINWPSNEKIKSCDVFCLGKPSMQGFSGGAAFLSVSKNLRIGDTTKLVGVISSTISDNTGGKLGAVIPIFYLWDLLD